MGICWTQACRMLICDFQNEKKFHLTIVHYDLSPVGFNDKVKVLFFPLQHEAAFLTLIVRHRPVENVPLALPSPRSRPRQLAVAGESWLWCDVASRTPQSLTYSPANRKPVNIVLLVYYCLFLWYRASIKLFKLNRELNLAKNEEELFDGQSIWCDVQRSLTWPDRVAKLGSESRDFRPLSVTSDKPPGEANIEYLHQVFIERSFTVTTLFLNL